MQDNIAEPQPKQFKPKLFRFHPIVRIFMITLGLIATGYSIYFIAILIPHTANFTIFFKILSVIVLYVSLSTVYSHLSGLNSVIIYDDHLELRFLLKKRISISWDRLQQMSIYKVITHYWKITYLDKKGKLRIFKTSLAFPGIITILMTIQDRKPDVELNELLKQVLIFKRKATNPEPPSSE